MKTVIITKGYWKKSSYVSRGSTGHWTKWGGARQDLIQSELAEIWMCQSCGRQQPKELTPYRYEYPTKEYLRVCAICLAEGCEELKRRMS